MAGIVSAVALLAGAVTPLAAAARDALAGAGLRVLRADGEPGLPVRIPAEHGPVGCLVYCAGTFGVDTALDSGQVELERHMTANVIGPALLAQAFAKALPATGHGLIINFADRSLSDPAPEPFSAALSQSALWSMTRLLAQALAPRIRVNLIAPGPALAALRPASVEGDDVAQRVGEAVRYLLRAEAVTGQMIALDLGAAATR